MSSIGVFDVATSGEDEQRMQKQAMHDRVAAAIYDVREKHGEWLFGAKDLDGFNDRAKLAFTSICQTIEPHLHARTGVHRKVMKALEHEWRQRLAVDYTGQGGEQMHADLTNLSGGPVMGVTGGPMGEAGTGLTVKSRRHTSCYPGCDKDEAHAKKFHKGEDSDEKEARRQAGPPVHQDPDRAHQVLDQTHQKVDEHAQKHHDILDRAHEKVDERAQGPSQNGDPWAPGYSDAAYGHGETAQDPNPGPPAPSAPDDYDHHYGDPINDLMQSPLGQNFQEQSPSFGKPVQPPLDPSHFASRYYAEFETEHGHPEQHLQQTFEDHQGDTLEPEGDFDGYKDSVDQGAESKVDHDFTAPDQRSPSPYSVERHDEDGSHNFVPTVTGARACPEYARIAAILHADISAPPGAPGMGAAGGGATAPNGAAQAAPMAAPAVDSTTAPAGGAGVAPVNPAAGAPMTASREYQAILGMVRQSAPGAPMPETGGTLQPGAGGIGTPGGTTPVTNIAVPGAQNRSVPGGLPSAVVQGPMSPGQFTGGRKWALKQIQEVGTKEARKRLLAVARSHGVINDKTAARVHTLLTRKVADSNYLQKADEALTKVLNEKAEEFQNTIAPLQQALITIQQAEQLANPLNVSPPAGTVNVLPGQQQGAPAPGGQPGMPGSLPPDGGGLGADPAAAGLAAQPPAQQLAASRRRASDYARHGEGLCDPNTCPWEHPEHEGPRPDARDFLPGGQHNDKRGGQGKARGGASPRKQGDAVGDFGKWLTKAPGLPNGSPTEVDDFVQQTHRGPRSDTKLHQQYGGGTVPHAPAPAAPASMAPKAPKMPKAPKQPKVPVMARTKKSLIAEPHHIWSKTPSTVHVEFANRMGSGTHPDDVFRQLVAEIAEHHSSGQINNRDAHRAANEAFGRLVMSRKKRGGHYVDEHGNPVADVSQHVNSGGRAFFVHPGETTNQVRRVHERAGDPFGDGPAAPFPETMHLSADDHRTGSRKQAWSGWGQPQRSRRHKVAGWEWNDYQNGYLSDRPRRFECSCGAPVEVPSYHNCKCGKIWNALVIGTGGDRHQASADTFIVREIPARKDVVVASRKRAADHFHDGDGRYTGPAKSNTSYPLDTYGGSDNCPGCGNHFAKGHDAECPHISKWGASQRGDLQSVPQKKHDSTSEELDESVSGEFPTKHSPKVDTRSKGVQNGKSTKDWHNRDHSSQQFRS